MAKPPAWLPALVDELVFDGGVGLWLGPDVSVGARADLVCVAASSAAERTDVTYAAVFVAASEAPDLAQQLRDLRSQCQPGAVWCLLLPEPVAGARARVARVFDPFGRMGRSPRSLSEMCGALLSAGASGVEVRRVDGQLRCVLGRLPEGSQPLDACFDVPPPATS